MQPTLNFLNRLSEPGYLGLSTLAGVSLTGAVVLFTAKTAAVAGLGIGILFAAPLLFTSVCASRLLDQFKLSPTTKYLSIAALVAAETVGLVALTCGVFAGSGILLGAVASTVLCVGVSIVAVKLYQAFNTPAPVPTGSVLEV